MSVSIAALRRELKILQRIDSHSSNRIDMAQAIEEDGAATGFLLPATYKERRRRMPQEKLGGTGKMN